MGLDMYLYSSKKLTQEEQLAYDSALAKAKYIKEKMSEAFKTVLNKAYEAQLKDFNSKCDVEHQLNSIDDLSYEQMAVASEAARTIVRSFKDCRELEDQQAQLEKEAEDLLNNAYTVSGLKDNVDKFIIDKKVVNIEEITNFKSATIIGKLNREERADIEVLDLKVTNVELQKLFIYLTEKEECLV